MDFLTLAKERFSLRKYSSRPVEKAKIDAVLAAAALAPTGCNNQPQRILLVDDTAVLEKIRRCTSYQFGAPITFVVCYDSSFSWHRSFDGQDYGPVDAAIVLTQMMLKIHELGLGSCFVGWFDPAALRRELELPEDVIPVGILPCGFPAADSRPIAMHASRKPLSETVVRI